jgi:hypothetical protein
MMGKNMTLNAFFPARITFLVRELPTEFLFFGLMQALMRKNDVT